MKNISWETKEVDVSILKNYEQNPRKITDRNKRLLQNSIEEFGLVKPIVVNTDMTVIGGNQRLEILKKKGGKVTVVFPSRELKEREIADIAIILNNKVGDWDFTKLQILGFEPDMLVEEFGFDQELVNSLAVDFDSLDFDVFDKDFTIKKLILNFCDFELSEVQELLTRGKEKYGVVTNEELLVKLVKQYNENNNA